MELHQLEYVIALEKYRNFSKAAVEINVSQSAFSHGIKKIEEQLGVQLFVRNNKAVSITPAGEEFVIHARQILAAVQNARNAMLAYSNLSQGTLKIGAIPAISYQGITKILCAFQKEYPNINLEIAEDSGINLIKKYNSLELNAIMINSLQLAKEFIPYAYPLVKDKMVLLVPHSHKLAERKWVELAELAGENFVIVAGFRNDLIKQCLAVGFKPNIISVSSQSITIKNFVEQNLGISPCTYSVAASLLSPKMRIVHFKPLIKRTTYLVIKDDLPINRLFKDYILRQIKSEQFAPLSKIS